MNGSIKRLPDSELEVMQAVWACTPPASKDEIRDKMGNDHPIAETTLLTFLSRLTDKGFLSVELRRRKKYYTPNISQDDYLAAQSRRFLDQLCGGSIPTFAAALCNSGLTKEELAELRDMLERGAL